MMVRNPRFLAFAGVAVIVCWLLTAAGANEKEESEIPRKAPETRPAPVVGIHDLMELYNRPFYEYAKAEIDKGEPESEERWKTLKERGLQAAELANLVAIRRVGRKSPERWSELTKDLQQEGLDLAHAAEARDWKATQGAWKSLVSACNHCHNTLAPDVAPTMKP